VLPSVDVEDVSVAPVAAVRLASVAMDVHRIVVLSKEHDKEASSINVVEIEK